MKDWAKLFHTPHGQALYIADYNDDGKPCIEEHIAIPYHGRIVVRAAYSQTDAGEKDRDRQFSSLSQLFAEQRVERVMRQYGHLPLDGLE